MSFLRKLSVRNNLITAIAAAIFVAFILSRTQPKYVDKMKSRELVGCYYYHDNKLIVNNGEIRYSNKVYSINRFRYFKNVLGFDSHYNISYIKDAEKLMIQKSPNGDGWKVFFMNDRNRPYVSFFGLDQNEEFKFYKDRC